ncbi:SCO2400 family protein [Streptomyces peucetius]
MDYCSTCRRHLNGALVCPGCGAYAPDIAPPPVHAAGATAPSWQPHGADETPVEPATPAGPSGQGRAARRRQLARWKKHKRRAAAGSAIAIVGGALTIAALPTDSGRSRAIAADAPDTAPTHRPASVAQPQERAALPSKAPRPSATETVKAVPRQRNTAAVSESVPTAVAAARPARTVSAPPSAPEAPRTEAPRPTATAAPAAPAEPPAASAPTADEPQTRPTQTATTSPTEVCLLVLCVG